MATLKLVKITPKQTRMMGELLAYFNGRRLHALRKMQSNPDWLEPIPLSKIYKAHKCNSNDKKAVKVAAAVFFRQMTRGNNITNTCSMWSVLETPHINNQVKKMVEELYEENKEHQFAVRTFLNTKEDDNTVVEVTTKFKFKNKEQAAMFAELMMQIEIEGDDEE